MIHNTAIISTKANISPNVEIGPYCIIEAGVSIDEGCELISHVHLSGNTNIGKHNKFFPFDYGVFAQLDRGTFVDYTEMTPGSYKESKETYILWNYENSDPEYGKMQAYELSKYLGQILKMKNVVRTHYQMSRLLEIKFKNISKRNATKIALGYFQSQLLLENIDRNDTFVMSIGNDISDDKICSLISDKFDDIKNKYTVTIGLRPTTADFYLNDVDEVSNIIRRLISSNNNEPIIRYSRFMDSLYKKI